MGIPICHGNGIDGARAPLKGGCDDLWDNQNREDLALAVAEAELLVSGELGTLPAPTWVVDEEVRVGRVRSDWWNAEFSTQWKRVEAFGTQTLTLIDGSSPVTYENLRHDPYNREETALIGEPGGMYYFPAGQCDDVCAVKVFFTEADGAWDSADPRWEIRPLRADVEPPGTRVQAESCMFLRPELQQWQYRHEWPEGSREWATDFDTDNLVDEVDVYCESTNTYLPITLYWEGLCDCGSPCSHSTQAACAYATDLDRGFFAPRPATGANAYTAALHSTPPVKFTVSYKAGWPLDSRTCRMDPRLERAIVKLANVLLPEPPCGFCDPARTKWERDRALMEPLTEAATLIPWGLMERGAFEAWRLVQSVMRGGRASVRGS